MNTCRSFLTPDRSGNGYDNVARAKNWVDGKPKYYGRMNLGVVTVNLADAALSSGGDMDKFWKLMEERTEMCHEVQKIRVDRLCHTKARVAPVLWCDGAFARLDPDDTLECIIKGGGCTASLGYAALWECVKYMTGYDHFVPEGKEFATQVMQFLNDKCDQWKAEDNVEFSPYGSPIEATTYKFAKHLKERFGVVEDITDKDHVVNSYHVPVWAEMTPFEKIKIESEFQKLSPGGAISYIEAANLEGNNEAMLQVIQYIYDNIMYAEINTKSDYCQVCGYDHAIELKADETGKYYWECPNCHNTDVGKMNIARRVCGYISTNPTNQGRLDDIAKRYVHADTHEDEES